MVVQITRLEWSKLTILRTSYVIISAISLYHIYIYNIDINIFNHEHIIFYFGEKISQSIMYLLH